MGARDEEGHHSPAQPRNTCSRKSSVVEDDSLQVSFLELQGEVTQFVDRAENAVIAMSSYRVHIRFKESVVNPRHLIYNPDVLSSLYSFVENGVKLMCIFNKTQAAALCILAFLESTYPIKNSLKVPLMLIENVECRDMLHLHITGKDCKVIRCRFFSAAQCQEWARRLTAAIRPPSRLEDLFSFAFHACCADVCTGDTCRPGDRVTSRFRDEVERMGFDTQGVWRISEINSKYRLCSSYPQLLLVPGWISDAELENVAAFRSWKRFPTVVYRHQSSGAVIARCAQPEVSWWGWRNSDDERLVQSIIKACAEDRRDCKHSANGTAALQQRYRRAWHEPANRSLPHECTDRSDEQSNGTHGDGSVSHEHANGSVSHEHSKRNVSYERTNGKISHEHGNGSVSHEHGDGVHSNRTLGNGGVSHENGNGTHGNRSVSHEHGNGAHSNGSVPHEHTNWSMSHEHTNESVSHEHTNGSMSHERTNGSVSQEYGNGNVTKRAFMHEHTSGTLLSHSEFDVSVSREVEGDCAHALSQKLLILDARSYAAAVANRAKGGGCECPEYYPDCEVVFMGMANIHCIRKSFQALRSLCTQMPDPANWLSALEATRWLQHLALLLKTASLVVTAVDRDRRPVLVHCSDGWDRTPQIVALSKLLLDPFYRTIEGFQVLVETEWLDFGHKFGDRCGHGEKAEDLNERCPVFLQWLDCVHQLHRQFPCSFQFNESFLVKLVQHTYSCLFGTFLCNSGRERDEGRVQERTCSLWSLLRPTNPAFQNILYSAHSETVLQPVCHVRSLMLWSAVYLPSSLPTSPSDDSCAPCPTPSPGASPEEEPLGRHPKTRSFEDLPSEAGGRTPPNRRSSDPNLKNKRPACHAPSRDLGHGAGRRVRRSSGQREDDRMAGEGFKEEEELFAAANEDEVAGPPVEERTEAELSVAVGMAAEEMEHFLQEATEDDQEHTAEPKRPAELSLAPPSPSPTAPPSPPPTAPPTHLPLEDWDGPEVCEQQAGGFERAPEMLGAPARPEHLTSVISGATRTSSCGDTDIAIETHTEIAIETNSEEGTARPNVVAHSTPCHSPPCLNSGTPCEAEPEHGQGLQRTPGCEGRRSPSTPPRVPSPGAPVCNRVPRLDGAGEEQSPLREWEPAGGRGSPASSPRVSPRCPQDGLAPHRDALQLPLRQMEAGHQLEVHTLKCQVQELWSRLETRHGNGQPSTQRTCSPGSDCSAESPCWERLEQQDTEVPQWYPDCLDRNCYRCNGRLWLAGGKHHCRTCGNVFCASCCELRVVVSNRSCEACRSALPPVDLELEKPMTA